MKKRAGVNMMFLSLLLSVLLMFSGFCVSASEEGGGAAYTTEQAAANAVRTFLVNRADTFSIPVKLDLGTNVEDLPEDQQKKRIDDLAKRIYLLSFEETDKGNEGDYLSNGLKGYHAEMPDYTVKGSTLSGSISYYMPLMTNAEQEKQVDQKVAQILRSLELDSKTDYHKIKAIYDYICGHVTYYFSPKAPEDEESAAFEEWGKKEELACTAYGALVNGEAVCHGYAVAVYRLMKEAGIGCRVITGEHPTDPGGNHAWNIVQLDGTYYYVDATWDADSFVKKTDYENFLRSQSSFKNDQHGVYKVVQEKPEFLAKYPISTTDFPYKEQGKPSEPGGKDDPEKKVQPMTVKGKSPSVRFSKAKNRTITKAKAFAITNAKGAISFKKVGGSARLLISKAGKITVRPGTKKGSYKIRVAVTAAGTAAYKAGTRRVTVTVTVK